MDGILIVPCTAHMIPAIEVIEKASFSDPWSAESLAAPLQDADTWCYFTALDEKTSEVIGYACAFAGGGQADIASLAVAPDFRRRGVARALLGALFDACTKRGVTHMFLEVRVSNTAARALYAAAGFQPCGVRRRYYRLPTEDALVLTREAPFTFPVPNMGQTV